MAESGANQGLVGREQRALPRRDPLSLGRAHQQSPVSASIGNRQPTTTPGRGAGAGPGTARCPPLRDPRPWFPPATGTDAGSDEASRSAKSVKGIYLYEHRTCPAAPGDGNCHRGNNPQIQKPERGLIGLWGHLSGMTRSLMVASTSAWRRSTTWYSPVVRNGPSGRRTS